MNLHDKVAAVILPTPGVGARCLVVAGVLAFPMALWAQLPPSLPPTDWTRANTAVAEFPRGHADVLRWEAQHQLEASDQPPPAPQAERIPLLSVEDVIRQAWRAHPDLVKALNKVGTVQAARVAQGRWIEVDPSLQRRVEGVDELFDVATQARKAWVQAVAARQVLAQQHKALEAAEAANELGRRMVSVGNWSRLQQTQVQLAQSAARMALRRGQYAAAQAEAELRTVLKLSTHPATLDLPDRLPDLPAQALSPQLLAERAAAIAGQLPWADGARNAANARLAKQAYLTSHALALSARDEVVKTREFISEETVLHYNGMLKSVWDVLAEAGNQSQAVVAAIEALRDFWLAEADLQWTLQGGAPTRFVSLGGGGGAGEPTAATGH